MEAKQSHVEIIDPLEKLSPGVGGTGYLGPRQAASASQLADDANEQLKRFPKLNMAVWKVLQSSVSWKRHAESRRLFVGGRTVPCKVIGSVYQWWFVSVNADQAAKILSATQATAARKGK